MKQWQLILLLGLVGVASLMLLPVELLVDTAMPPMALRALTMIQPAILTGIAVLVGGLTAPKVGLEAPAIRAVVNGDSPLPAVKRQCIPALVVGAIGAVVLVLYQLGPGSTLTGTTGFDTPLLTRILYGGITEEILTRWGLVSLFVWLGWLMWRRPASLPPGITAMAVGLAAALFAAGHLPTLYALESGADGALVMAVLLGNAIPGILFGMLFVRRGLEAAMMAHMATHLLAAVVLAVV